MSGQLHGVTVTSVHLTVLASSIPVSHLTLPQLCGYNPASHLPVLCAHKGLRAQLASGATWIQSCSLQAKLNNPTHNRWNFVFLLFLYTHPSLLLSLYLCSSDRILLAPLHLSKQSQEFTKYTVSKRKCAPQRVTNTSNILKHKGWVILMLLWWRPTRNPP